LSATPDDEDPFDENGNFLWIPTSCAGHTGWQYESGSITISTVDSPGPPPPALQFPHFEATFTPASMHFVNATGWNKAWFEPDAEQTASDNLYNYRWTYDFDDNGFAEMSCSKDGFMFMVNYRAAYTGATLGPLVPVSPVQHREETTWANEEVDWGQCGGGGGSIQANMTLVNSGEKHAAMRPNVCMQTCYTLWHVTYIINLGTFEVTEHWVAMSSWCDQPYQ